MNAYLDAVPRTCSSFMTSVARRTWLQYLSLTWWKYLQCKVSTMQLWSTMSTVNYELLHCHMGHPSRDVLRVGQKHIYDFLDVNIPFNEPVCSGCELGKQSNHPFTHNEMCVTKLFELVHSDLKSFPVESYISQVQIHHHFLWWLHIYGLGTRNRLKRPSLAGCQSFP